MVNIDRDTGQLWEDIMVCCVTGHRSVGFPFSRDSATKPYQRYIQALEDEIVSLVNQGYTHFITGMAEGADLDFAQAVILQQDKHSFIELEAAYPYPPQPAKEWTEYQERREWINERVKLKCVVSDHYYRGCMQKRNRYMVDKADIVLAIWNGKQSGGTWNTIKYAQSKNKPIKYIMLNDFHENLQNT